MDGIMRKNETMADKYINATALLEQMPEVPYKGSLRRVLMQAPAADVAPVRHGRWIPDYDYAEYDYDGCTRLPEPRKFQDGWQCILCGQYMPSEANYCPNCGADMREVDE